MIGPSERRFDWLTGDSKIINIWSRFKINNFKLPRFIRLVNNRISSGWFGSGFPKKCKITKFSYYFGSWLTETTIGLEHTYDRMTTIVTHLSRNIFGKNLFEVYFVPMAGKFQFGVVLHIQQIFSIQPDQKEVDRHYPSPSTKIRFKGTRSNHRQ